MNLTSELSVARGLMTFASKTNVSSFYQAHRKGERNNKVSEWTKKKVLIYLKGEGKM